MQYILTQEELDRLKITENDSRNINDALDFFMKEADACVSRDDAHWNGGHYIINKYAFQKALHNFSEAIRIK